MGETLNQKIVLGAGCFWCLEAALQNLEGVVQVTSGYAGGNSSNPTYDSICSGKSDHAEVIQVEYNPETISLEKILEIFFLMHDPTSLNRQGNDVGTQYRSIILYTTPEQKTIAEKVMTETQKEFDQPLVTILEPLKVFYPAEDYHQRYYEKNPNQAYCQFVIRPKLEKVERYL